MGRVTVGEFVAANTVAAVTGACNLAELSPPSCFSTLAVFAASTISVRAKIQSGRFGP
jgi:hypothetical protein